MTADQLNELLKNVRGRESFSVFMHAMRQSKEGDFHLYGRRRGYAAFSFTPHPYKLGYAHYLLDDGVSTGTCRWENLYRVLTVR